MKKEFKGSAPDLSTILETWNSVDVCVKDINMHTNRAECHDKRKIYNDTENKYSLFIRREGKSMVVYTRDNFALGEFNDFETARKFVADVNAISDDDYSTLLENASDFE